MKAIFKSLKWITAGLSVWTMTFAPVAMGQEAKRLSQQQLEEAILTLGLNKQMTVGEFYEKNKYLVPDRLKSDMEAIVTVARNQPMPTFELISNKGTAGYGVPTLRVSQGGELINIQWFGEDEKYIKFQNTNLSQIDIINFNDMFTRILAGDEKFRRQIEIPTPNKMATKFEYPDVTPWQWATMPNSAKAAYILNLRMMWHDARQVLDISERLQQTKKKKTSSFIFQQAQPFMDMIFGQNAEAAGLKYLTAKSCIVAGYVSEYVSTPTGEVCSVNKAKSNYANDDLYKAASAKCQTNQIACNPYIYGATSDGNPFCIDYSTKNADFQKATHFDGPCDKQSRLQSSSDEFSFLKDNSPAKGKGRYNADNLKVSTADMQEHFRQDHATNKTLTENYILGVLRLKGLTTETDFSKVVLDEKAIKVVMDIKTQFETEINKAKQTCEQVADQGGGVEKNYWQACDQLHRRFLFVDQAIKAKCDASGLPFNQEKLCCTCPVTPPPAPPTTTVVPPPAVSTTTVTPVTPPATSTTTTVTPTTVPPGGTCIPTVPAVTPVKPAVVDKPTKVTCDETFSNAPDCTCGDGKPPVVDSKDGDGVTSYKCAGSEPTKPPKGKPGQKEDDCSLLCKIGKGLKAVAPFAIAGVAAYFIFKTMAPKKPALAAPADKCPNGSLPPCMQTCTPPLKLQPTGNCSCDGCPPGQSADLTTCNCSTSTTGGTGGTTTILCPDSVTRAANLAACPDYPCWNGQSYKNPINCPPAPATTSTVRSNQ